MDVTEFVNSQPANQQFGIELLDAMDGVSEGRLTHSKEFCFNRNDNTYLHGGVSFAFADTIGAAAVMSYYEEVQPAVTINMRIDYQAVASDDLHATAEVTRYGSSQATVDIEVTQPNTGEQVVLARGAYATE
jgi:uncharacterized protein (TIGR00369 family)